jgi:hypothetical protein
MSQVPEGKLRNVFDDGGNGKQHAPIRFLPGQACLAALHRQAQGAIFRRAEECTKLAALHWMAGELLGRERTRRLAPLGPGIADRLSISSEADMERSYLRCNRWRN